MVPDIYRTNESKIHLVQRVYTGTASLRLGKFCYTKINWLIALAAVLWLRFILPPGGQKLLDAALNVSLKQH